MMKEDIDTLTFAKRLKYATRVNHDSVDSLVMQAEPFANAGRYGQFLRLQHVFHLSMAPLYQQASLQALFPGLAQLGNVAAVESD